MDDCRGKRQRRGAPPESEELLRMQRNHLLNRQRGKQNFWVGSPRLDLTLPIGSSLDEYLAPCGSIKVRPKPSWYSLPIATTTTTTPTRQPEDSHGRKRARDDEENNNKHNNSDERGESDAMQVDEANEQSTPKPDSNVNGDAKASPQVVVMKKTKMELFGPDNDSALHMAIRYHATEAALQLIGLGADVTHRNAKQVTPLILSCQKGNPHVVRALLAEGVPTGDTSLTGATALLQASHFGRLIIVNLLLENGADPEQASNKDTTPLMRASQEGHVDVVQALLKYGAAVNRSNQDQMSAIMLASQRGHPQVVRVLARAHGQIDATTHQGWTPLMLACKRDHKEVVKILLAEGCELMQRDTRGRTAAEIAYRREDKGMLQILKPTVQVELMQYKHRTLRQHTMVEVWTLLQHERALVPLSEKHEAVIHHVRRDSPHLSVMGTSRSALVRTMTLPAGLVQIIASFLPLPHCWEQRQRLILRRCNIDADSAVDSALHLLDEVLEEGGFLEACDTAGLEPPLGFDSWFAWRAFGKTSKGRPPSRSARRKLPGLPRWAPGGQHWLPVGSNKPTTPFEQRRGMCYLVQLARSPRLAQVLWLPPYNMPEKLIQELINVSDIQSVSRRLTPTSVKFGSPLAMEMAMLASRVCSWFSTYRQDNLLVARPPVTEVLNAISPHLSDAREWPKRERRR